MERAPTIEETPEVAALEAREAFEHGHCECECQFVFEHEVCATCGAVVGHGCPESEPCTCCTVRCESCRLFDR